MSCRAVRRLMSLIWLVSLTSCYQSTGLYPNPPGFRRIDPGGEYTYTEPDLSFDGKNLAYTRYDEPGNKGYYYFTGEIFVLNLENHQARQLTANEAMDASPSWSPDGKQIVYHRQAYEFDQHHAVSVTTDTLQITNSDGTEDRTIYLCPFECGSPSWSPDGTQIAFAGWTGPDTFDLATEPAMYIYLIQPEGTNMMRLTKAANHATAPRWSPDGRQIVFRNWVEDQIWVVDVSTGHETLLETNGLRSLRSPDWTPDHLHRESLYLLDLSHSEVKPFFRQEINFLTYAQIRGPRISLDSKTLVLGLYPAIYGVDLSVAENNWR